MEIKAKLMPHLVDFLDTTKNMANHDKCPYKGEMRDLSQTREKAM